MRSVATVLTFQQARVVKLPHHNKVCWVSNLQGKVTVPGRRCALVDGKKRRGTLFWLWFFKSINFLSVRQRCSADADSFTVMRDGGGRGGLMSNGVASISDKMASALPQISTFFSFLPTRVWKDMTALRWVKHTLMLRSPMQKWYILTFFHCVRAIHVCTDKMDWKALSPTLVWVWGLSHTLFFSYILCLSINNTDSFGLVDRICNGVCITSSSDWPGDYPLDWLFLSNW